MSRHDQTFISIGYLFKTRGLWTFHSQSCTDIHFIHRNVSFYCELDSHNHCSILIQVSHKSLLSVKYFHHGMPSSLRKLWQNTFSKYHVQLCLSLLLMLIVAFLLVVFSAEKVATLYGGCVTVSVLVHYFTLVAVMWMGAEALLMFQKLVIVHVRITTKFIVFISTLCWCKHLTNVSSHLV